MIRPQHVYLAVDFIFENGKPKSKFFVVFHCDEDEVLLFSLTTIQSKLPDSLDKVDQDGCVQFSDERGYGHVFIWKEGQEIGTNGYVFKKRTYVQLEFRTQLKEVAASSISKLATEKIIEKCCLTDSMFCDLLRCLLQSKFLKQKHRRAILLTVEKLGL